MSEIFTEYDDNNVPIYYFKEKSPSPYTMKVAVLFDYSGVEISANYGDESVVVGTDDIESLIEAIKMARKDIEEA